MKKYIHKITIEENSIDDLDWNLQNEFGVDDEIEIDIIEIGDSYTEAHIINIDSIVNELQNLKANGATHVAIDYHVDHIGYNISSFLVRESTDEEINSYLTKKDALEKKEIKRLELIKQLKELDEERELYQKDNSKDLPF
jgi:hypothetical protein